MIHPPPDAYAVARDQASVYQAVVWGWGRCRPLHGSRRGSCEAFLDAVVPYDATDDEGRLTRCWFTVRWHRRLAWTPADERCGDVITKEQMVEDDPAPHARLGLFDAMTVHAGDEDR